MLVLTASAAANHRSTADQTGRYGTEMSDRATRSARKRRAIMDAATTVFLRNGYVGASMDEVAALAAVSKQTVYKHFADKESLFSEIVTGTVDEAGDRVHASVLELADSGDVEADLRALARRQLALVMQPRVLQLRRLVIGEAGRLPPPRPPLYQPRPGGAGGGLPRALPRA